MTLHGYNYRNYRKLCCQTQIIYLSKRRPNFAILKGCNTFFLKFSADVNGKKYVIRIQYRSLSPSLMNIGYLTEVTTVAELVSFV